MYHQGSVYNYDATAIRPPFDSQLVTTLRPLHELRYDCMATCVCGLLHCDLNK